MQASPCATVYFHPPVLLSEVSEVCVMHMCTYYADTRQENLRSPGEIYLGKPSDLQPDYRKQVSFFLKKEITLLNKARLLK